MVLFCAMPGSTAYACSATALVLWVYSCYFLREGELGFCGRLCPALMVGSASHAEWRSVHRRIF